MDLEQELFVPSERSLKMTSTSLYPHLLISWFKLSAHLIQFIGSGWLKNSDKSDFGPSRRSVLHIFKSVLPLRRKSALTPQSVIEHNFIFQKPFPKAPRKRRQEICEFHCQKKKREKKRKEKKRKKERKWKRKPSRFWFKWLHGRIPCKYLPLTQFSSFENPTETLISSASFDHP